MKVADYLILCSDYKPNSEKETIECFTKIGVRMLDCELHSIKQFTYGGDTDIEIFWRKISMYRCRDTVLVVWNAGDESLIRELDLKYRMSLKLRFIRVNELIGSMVSYVGYEPKNFGKTVQKLGLSWSHTKSKDMDYLAKTLSKVLRKMYRLGESRLGEDFIRYAKSGMFYHISKYEYFRVSKKSLEYISRKKYLSDRKKELIKLLRDKWDAVNVDGDIICIQTDRANWRVEAIMPIEKLYYRTMRYYRGTRILKVNNSAVDVETNSRVIINAIRRTEQKLAKNIGNETISRYLDAVGRKCSG